MSLFAAAAQISAERLAHKRAATERARRASATSARKARRARTPLINPRTGLRDRRNVSLADVDAHMQKRARFKRLQARI